MTHQLNISKSPQKWRPQKTQMMKKNFISEIKIILSINSNVKVISVFFLIL